jgi:hypothetical protein
MINVFAGKVRKAGFFQKRVFRVIRTEFLAFAIGFFVRLRKTMVGTPGLVSYEFAVKQGRIGEELLTRSASPILPQELLAPAGTAFP